MRQLDRAIVIGPARRRARSRSRSTARNLKGPSPFRLAAHAVQAEPPPRARRRRLGLVAAPRPPPVAPEGVTFFGVAREVTPLSKTRREQLAPERELQVPPPALRG